MTKAVLCVNGEPSPTRLISVHIGGVQVFPKPPPPPPPEPVTFTITLSKREAKRMELALQRLFFGARESGSG